jgi:hypothetical protein
MLAPIRSILLAEIRVTPEPIERIGRDGMAEPIRFSVVLASALSHLCPHRPHAHVTNKALDDDAIGGHARVVKPSGNAGYRLRDPRWSYKIHGG